MFTLVASDDFRPEEYGWEVSNPVVPSQQLQAAMQELHRFGFVSTQYARWQVPYAMRFVLTVAGYSPERRMYRLFYMRPFECPGEEITRGVLWDEIRWGYGRPGGSEGHPFVSQSMK
ncbi:hypothetical protein [Streptomyces sp. NPDC017260]|uniref:hypothetical protein n=1 Tax=unclassified Streptomyces TaxID=2593676 RepID=UPI0037B6CD4F